MPFSCDATIAILLYKLAMAAVFFITALEALAFLCLLNSPAVALAILVCSLKLIAIGIMYCHLTVNLAILEHPVEGVTVLLSQFATTILLVIFPLTHIAIAIDPSERSVARLVTIEETS